MDLPKLHFYYAYPFDAGRRALFAERAESYPASEDVQQKVGEYRTLWEEENAGDRIMRLVVEKTGVTLQRDLEVWIFGRGMTAMSSPFLVPAFHRDGSAYTRDELIEIFIHETLHRFVGFTENNAGIEGYWDACRVEYADESAATQNHVLIYALLTVILTELYGAQKAQDMIAPTNDDYKRAVAIVKEKGADVLIGQFRSFLK